MKPHEIEELSFEIIDREAGDHGFNQEKWPIVRRMIHTSADFEYINTIKFSENAVQKGCQIFTDTKIDLPCRKKN